MGATCGKKIMAKTAPSPPPESEDASFEWSEEKLLAALNVMPQAVSEASTSQLKTPKLLPQPLRQEIASHFGKWSFDIFMVPAAELPDLAYWALMGHPEISAQPGKIDHMKLWRFICEIASRYHDSRPFHSFRHGVDVLLATSCLLRLMRQNTPQGLDDPVFTAALLIAALVHDTNHPGCMNGFLIAIQHPLATSSTEAVLERHHAEMALTLLERPELDFIASLPPEDRKRFVDHLQKMVLATDVTTTMAAAKEAVSLNSESVALSADQRMVLIMKAADISNPARQLKVYKRWIDGVMAEFFAQGDAERARALPISMNCDREVVRVNQAQINFISFLVAPLFKSLAAFAPSIGPLFEELEANKAHFVALESLEVKPTPSTS